MAKIINNSDSLLSVQSQNAVQNAAANVGADTVRVTRISSNNEGETFEIYDEGDDATYIGRFNTADNMVTE
jgi:hypothetical protein